jgi:hypothetical protein
MVREDDLHFLPARARASPSAAQQKENRSDVEYADHHGKGHTIPSGALTQASPQSIMVSITVHLTHI